MTVFGVLGVLQSQTWWEGRVLAERVWDGEVGDGEARVSGRALVKSRPHLEAFTVNGTEPFSAETDRIFHYWNLPDPNTFFCAEYRELCWLNFQKFACVEQGPTACLDQVPFNNAPIAVELLRRWSSKLVWENSPTTLLFPGWPMTVLEHSNCTKAIMLPFSG